MLNRLKVNDHTILKNGVIFTKRGICGFYLYEGNMTIKNYLNFICLEIVDHVDQKKK